MMFFFVLFALMSSGKRANNTKATPVTHLCEVTSLCFSNLKNYTSTKENILAAQTSTNIAQLIGQLGKCTNYVFYQRLRILSNNLS